MMRTSQHRGYTLLEMMISLTIFSLVMVLATGALFAFVSGDRKSRSTNDVTNNLTFAMESMTRSIRTGTNFQCGGQGGANCWPTGQGTFTFVDQNGSTVTYLKKTDGSIGKCTTTPCTASNAFALTDPRITIQNMTFYVRGVGGVATAGADATLQPQVLITVTGYIVPDPKTAPVQFTLQTMATQRLIDL
ncbi:MAG: type II secretion system protein [Candidatus Pacebacteria bacterium]|nr:type II secretion system protein [Candidatus Paceibacterota bacterium]